MGAYLDRPRVEKDSHDGTGKDGLPFAVSEMQGWRKNHEDAHITEPELGKDKDLSLYGVFDGHGGREVAIFCANHLGEELMELESFKQGDYSAALSEAFHRMDRMLRDKDFAGELQWIRSQPDDAYASSLQPYEKGANSSSNDSGSGSNGSDEDETDGNAPKTTKESMQADVREKMAAAEQKGSLSKSEALELVMKMVKLKKLEDQDTSGEGGSSLAVASYTDAGCTANVVLRYNNKLYVANAGDSRAVMCCEGSAKQLSFDHKPTQEAERTRIEQAGGYVNEVGRVNGNLNLSRSIGDLRYKLDQTIPPEAQIITAQPDVQVYEITNNDEYFVIACDGVFDVLSNDELVAFINTRLAQGKTPISTIIEDIFEECICDNPTAAQGIGGDNMTCIIVLLKPLSYFTQSQ